MATWLQIGYIHAWGFPLIWPYTEEALWRQWKRALASSTTSEQCWPWEHHRLSELNWIWVMGKVRFTIWLHKHTGIESRRQVWHLQSFIYPTWTSGYPFWCFPTFYSAAYTWWDLHDWQETMALHVDVQKRTINCLWCLHYYLDCKQQLALITPSTDALNTCII